MATTLRDRILPKIDKARTLIGTTGLRRYSVVIRRRTWASGSPGIGSPIDESTTITPPPKVRVLSVKEVADSGGTYQDGDLKLDRITPRYTTPTEGGYSPENLRLSVGPGEDVAIILTGDEGAFECQLVEANFDRAFGYKLVVRRSRGPVRG